MVFLGFDFYDLRMRKSKPKENTAQTEQRLHAPRDPAAEAVEMRFPDRCVCLTWLLKYHWYYIRKKCDTAGGGKNS